MKKLLVAGCLALAAITGSGSLWLQFKSAVGQVLLDEAWARASVSGSAEKAWPWADTWPVARLELPDKGASLVVLEGVTGEAMAFGPGRIPQSSATALNGTFAIGGHRDSHLAFLEHIEHGDNFNLQTLDGASTQFEVVDRFVANSQTDPFLLPKELHALVLITCYPFNALQTGGPLRYVVVAVPVANKVDVVG